MVHGGGRVKAREAFRLENAKGTVSSIAHRDWENPRKMQSTVKSQHRETNNLHTQLLHGDGRSF